MGLPAIRAALLATGRTIATPRFRRINQDPSNFQQSRRVQANCYRHPRNSRLLASANVEIPRNQARPCPPWEGVYGAWAAVAVYAILLVPFAARAGWGLPIRRSGA